VPLSKNDCGEELESRYALTIVVFGVVAVAHWSRQRSYSTSSPVSTGMGDRQVMLSATQVNSAWPSLRE